MPQKQEHIYVEIFPGNWVPERHAGTRVPRRQHGNTRRFGQGLASKNWWVPVRGGHLKKPIPNIDAIMRTLHSFTSTLSPKASASQMSGAAALALYLKKCELISGTTVDRGELQLFDGNDNDVDKVLTFFVVVVYAAYFSFWILSFQEAYLDRFSSYDSILTPFNLRPTGAKYELPTRHVNGLGELHHRELPHVYVFS